MYIAVCTPPIDTTNIQISPMLQDNDDNKDTVWTRNKCSTVKTEKSTITPVDNNSDKGCSYEQDIPLHTQTLQADRLPAKPKIVQTNNLGNLPTTSLSFFPTKRK